MTYLVKFITLSLFFSVNYLTAMEGSSVKSQDEFGEFQSAPELQNEDSSEKKESKSLSNVLVEDSCSASQEDVTGSPINESLICVASDEKDNTQSLSGKQSGIDNSFDSDNNSKSSMNASCSSEEKKSKRSSKSSSKSSSRSLSKSRSASKSNKASESSKSEISQATSNSSNSSSDQEEDIDSSSSSSYETSASLDSDDGGDKINIENLRNVYLEKNIEIDNSSDFVRFFKEDYEWSEQSKVVLDELAFKLAQGQKLNIDEKKEYTTYEKLIVCIAELIRPQIVLVGKVKEGLDKESLKLLESKNDFIEGIPKNTDKITKVKASLNNSSSFNLIQLVKSNKNKVTSQQKDVIDLDSIGSCITFNEYNNVIYIGCKNGFIYAFDVETKELVATFKAHKKPVSALKIIENGSAFISHANEDATYVWSINDTRARIKLEDKEYSKLYISDDGHQLIRSHLGGKSLVSSYLGSVSVIDGTYTIPHGYLQAMVPGDNAERIAFLYCMQLLHNKKIDSRFFPGIPKALLNSFVINTFEPPVTKALKLQLEKYKNIDQE